MARHFLLSAASRTRAANLWEREGGNAEAIFLLTLNQTSLPNGEISVEALAVDDIMSLSTELGGYFGIDWGNLTSLYSSKCSQR